MAERRMFAKSVIERSDAFMELPISSKCLYFAFVIEADDDGFIGAPRSVMRQYGASIDDINCLTARSFIIPFDNGAIVIRHWKVHNYIKPDRYKKTVFNQQLSQLILHEGVYYTEDEADPAWSTSGDETGPQVIGIDRVIDIDIDRVIDKPKKKSTKESASRRFTVPTIEEITEYISSNPKYASVDPERFYDFYSSKGWMVGKSKMKDWKAAVRNWARNNGTRRNGNEQEQEIDLGKYANAF